MSPPVICVIRMKKQKAICGKKLNAQVGIHKYRYYNTVIPKLLVIAYSHCHH